MKIAFISTFLVDYSVEICRNLCVDNGIVLISDENRLESSFDESEVQEFQKKFQIETIRQSRIWWRWYAVLYTSLTLLRFRPDIVIGHEHSHPHVTWIYRLAARISRLCLIVHDPVPHIGRDATFQIKNAAETRVQRDLASILFAHGTDCTRTLKAMMPARYDAIREIPLGANFFPPVPGPVQHSRRILMFGRMEAYKGLKLLLAAVKDLRSRRDDFVLVLAGAGPSLDALQLDFEALGCCEIYSSFISKRQAIELFNGCDVLVAPYHEASQSGVVAQAFAFGRPVVATAVGGLPDVIRDGVNGRLVAAEDATGLSQALEDCLYYDGRLEFLSAGAAKTYREELSWARISERVFTEIKSVL